MNKPELKIINDAAGRLIVGEVQKDDEDVLILRNPHVIADYRDQQSGRTNLALLPLCYSEILKDFGVGNNYIFNKSNITVSDAIPSDMFAEKYIEQITKIKQAYDGLLKSENNRQEEPQSEDGKVIKLFDE